MSWMCFTDTEKDKETFFTEPTRRDIALPTPWFSPQFLRTLKLEPCRQQRGLYNWDLMKSNMSSIPLENSTQRHCDILTSYKPMGKVLHPECSVPMVPSIVPKAWDTTGGKSTLVSDSHGISEQWSVQWSEHMKNWHAWGNADGNICRAVCTPTKEWIGQNFHFWLIFRPDLEDLCKQDLRIWG